MQAELQERAERPAYVRFERMAIEDKVASLREKRYIGRDVDFAKITPPYSKDVVVVEVEQWFENMRRELAADRFPRTWYEMYLKAYEAFKNGQEIPLNGSPIRGWGVISPAQQEVLIRMNILTVEDLAGVNDEGIRRIGMGGTDLKNKARTWLAQLSDKGPLTIEMAALKQENENLKGSLAAIQEQVRQMQAQIGLKPVEDVSDSIVPEIPEVRRGRRKDAQA